MKEKSKKQLDAITLGKLDVNVLIEFGSRVEGTSREESDYDVGVLFVNTQTPASRRYGALYAILQDQYPDQRIDLVDLSQAPFPLQFRAAMKGRPIYEHDASSFADFRERAMLSYFDFKPILKIHEEALGIYD